MANLKEITRENAALRKRVSQLSAAILSARFRSHKRSLTPGRLRVAARREGLHVATTVLDEGRGMAPEQGAVDYVVKPFPPPLPLRVMWRRQ